MRDEFRALYEDEQRRHLRPPPGRRLVEGGGIARVVGPTPHPLDDMVCWSALDAGNADAAIRALVDEADREARGMQWNVFDSDQPADLVARLERHGFEALPTEDVMVLPTDATLPPASSRAPIDVRRVLRASDLDVAIRIQEAVWGPGHTEWLLQWWKPMLAGEGEPAAIFVAYVGGEPAGLAWVTLPRGAAFANLFGGTVLPEFRRRGVHRTLVAARARVAAEAGLRWLVVEANANSAPLLLRAGFRVVARRTEMVRPPRPPDSPATSQK